MALCRNCKTSRWQPWVLPLGLICLWEWAGRLGLLPTSVFAPFSDGLVSLYWLAKSGDLARHTYTSLQRLLIGTSFGAVAGLTLGSAVSVSSQWERFIGPTIRFLSPVPPIAWIPLLISTAGISGSRVLLIAIGTMFIVFGATHAGMRAVNREYIEVAISYGKSKSAILFQVLFPAAIGGIVSGIRTALGIAWILLVASELIASSDGLGWLMWDARSFSRPNDMLAACIAIAILGYATDAIMAFLHIKIRPWQLDFHGL